MNSRAPEGDWAEQHLETLSWVVQVGERMRQLDRQADGDSEASRAFVEALLLAVFTKDGFAVADGVRTRENLSLPELNALRLLGLQWPKPPEFDPESLGDLVDVAQSVREMVEGSQALAPEVRIYFLALVEHLQAALDEVETNGSADVARLSNELAGALLTHFGDGAPEEQAKTQGFVRRIVVAVRRSAGFVVLAAIEGASSGLAQGMIAP